ncbi:hypothetical protein HN709_03115 [Candidatus Peregrinibacteria bacterium]|jgi:hypothetical protein|nr:hypothetical protein [Candidatus Peregrinibacteria bacterium]
MVQDQKISGSDSGDESFSLSKLSVEETGNMLQGIFDLARARRKNRISSNEQSDMDVLEKKLSDL